MKKAITLGLILVMAFVVPMIALPDIAFAGGYHNFKKNINGSGDFKDHNEPVLGGKFDAPNIVLLPFDLSLGIEGGKDVFNVEFDEGWFGYGKVTWNGTLFNLSGKK